MLDLKKLHSSLKEKGYHYFAGSTSSKSDSMTLMFSKGHNGRGDTFDININGDESNDVITRSEVACESKSIQAKNINNDSVFKLIDSL